LQLAIAIAAPQAIIDLLHTWQFPAGTHGLTTPNPSEGPMAALRSQIIEHGEKQGKSLVTRYGAAGPTLRFTQDYGSAASTIQNRLDEGSYDLVAMGTHGYRGVRRFLSAASPRPPFATPHARCWWRAAPRPRSASRRL
jgi:nucleotide-binding universal stress UspA family protein